MSRNHYNFLGLLRFDVVASSDLPPGKHQMRMEFAHDSGGLGKGAGITLYVDGAKVGEGRVERSHAFLFSMDETMDVGCEAGEPVLPDYGPRDNAFSARIGRVCIDIDEAAKAADHLIGAEERFNLAMARQ